ncbi:MAG: SPOR domain-containing protein [Treponema sp.]|nr:SPOR domain-containing protein [Treponema sp.]
MEKEMKKLLLVAISVGVFLLVTVTVAIIILTPKPQSHEIVYSSILKTQDITQPFQDPITTEPTIIPAESANIAAMDRNDGDSVTIHVRNPSAIIPDNQQTRTEGARTNVIRQPAATAETRTSPATTPAAPTQPTRPATTAQPATAASSGSSTAARTSTTPARVINDYWVQTGAFAAKIRAEDAKEFLASKGITSIIENREINGRLWYRVRLGPYISENEAKHWLDIVKVIDGFAESQIRQTVRTN